MAMNSTNVCGISPIYDYQEDGISYKFGGDLYCNGQITSAYYENIDSGTTSETSILSRNKYFVWGKDDLSDNDSVVINVSDDGGPVVLDSDDNEETVTRNEIYLVDIVMVDDTIAVLSDAGQIYTLGKNYNGTLGIESSDKFLNQLEPVLVQNDSSVVFQSIFALRDIDCFGALDTNNQFWIWGERSNGTAITLPTRLDDSGKKYNEDSIFVNSTEFLLKGVDNVFYKTTGDNSIESMTSIPSSAISASILTEDSNEYYLYINEDLELIGSDDLLTCRSKAGNLCSAERNRDLFNLSLGKLNEKSNTIGSAQYANFSNVSVYKLEHTIYESEIEDFEGTVDGWTATLNSTDGIDAEISRTNPPISEATETTSSDGVERVDPTKVLGRFKLDETVEKTYELGSAYANKEIELEFDFFEIDSWDFERFNVYLNDVLYTNDGFIHDNHETYTDTNDTGIYTLNLGSTYTTNSKYNDEKYHYKIKSTLDENGKVVVKFGVTTHDGAWGYAQSLSDESWAVDNVQIKVKETNEHFVCTMTGVDTQSQMYCWGEVGYNIPLLSTSLYDDAKIKNNYSVNSLNKLFITEEEDKTKQMSGDEFFDDGKLYLKYPAYIGGFDYPFYFK
jgi:hypothetical protein